MKTLSPREIAWIQFNVPIKPSSNAMSRSAAVQGDDGMSITRELVDGVLHVVLRYGEVVTEVPWTNVAAVGYRA